MSTVNPFQETEQIQDKPTTLLNVATILSIINSAFALLQSISQYFNAEKNYQKIKEMMNPENIDKAPDFVKSLYNERTLMMTQKMVENKLPIFILGLLGATLCLLGAIQMRKLRKDGYILWLTGEILPILSTVIFVGAATYSGIGLINLIFPVVFIVIYSLCRKELVS